MGLRTEKGGGMRYALVLMVVVMVLAGGRAVAQQFDLPQQSSQGQAPAYRRLSPSPSPLPPAPPGSDVRTLPQVAPQGPVPGPSSAYQPPVHAQPQPTPPRGQAYQAQPVLPAIFRGCWQGRVEYLDSLERLPGGARLGFWTPKTYRLCYRRIGDGPFVLTFTEAGIEPNDRIINAQGRMTLLSSDGRRYASMRSDLDFDEYRRHASYSGNDTFAVHEIADLDCSIQSDGMHVKGIVTGSRNGAPWFRARWHAVFMHEGEPPQQVEAPPEGIPE